MSRRILIGLVAAIAVAAGSISRRIGGTFPDRLEVTARLLRVTPLR